MSHEPKPSEHAIAPAVAERDRRIAELEAMLRKYIQACYDGGENLSALRNEELHAEASALLLAKSERSAP